MAVFLGVADRAARDHHRARHRRSRELPRERTRKQIGTRRAVGARRIDILRYFMVENWILTTAGLVVGCVLAYVFGSG